MLQVLFLPSVGMSESFQDYAWIQDFEADFPKKIQPQNSEFDMQFIIASYLFSVYLKIIDHLNLVNIL